MGTKVKSNEQFMLLSAIGIIVVVFCHMPAELFAFTEIFPFITLFVFVSGYFYKEQNEDNIGSYIYYKFKKLIIPFLIINLVYGIIIAREAQKDESGRFNPHDAKIYGDKKGIRGLHSVLSSR